MLRKLSGSVQGPGMRRSLDASWGWWGAPTFTRGKDAGAPPTPTSGVGGGGPRSSMLTTWTLTVAKVAPFSAQIWPKDTPEWTEHQTCGCVPLDVRVPLTKLIPHSVFPERRQALPMLTPARRARGGSGVLLPAACSSPQRGSPRPGRVPIPAVLCKSLKSGSQ